MRRFIAIILCLCFMSTSFAFADTVLTEPGTATTEVVLKADPPTFSATVPTVLAIGMAGDGTIYTAHNAKIVNNGHGPIRIVGLAVKGKNSWETIDFDSATTANLAVGSKKVALSIDGEKTTGKDLITFSQYNHPAMSGVGGFGNEQIIEYDAKIPLQKTLLDTTQGIVDVFFTLSWYEE